MESKFQNEEEKCIMNLTKKTITQVKKAIKKSGNWTGLLVPNKVNQYHFLNGWHLATRQSFDNIHDLEIIVNELMFHMEPELGNRVAFYEMEGE